MKTTLLAAVTLAVVCFPLQPFASPTVVGLQAENSANTASIYTDTTNQDLLWVTPPTLGRLHINQESIAIDESTCQSVASLHRTRRSMFAQLENYNRQIESIQLAISSIIDAVAANPGADAKVSDQISFWSDLHETTIAKRDNILKLLGSDSLSPHLLASAGYYSFVAKSYWDSALSTVRSRNPDKAVNPVITSGAQLNVSVVGAKGFEANELIANVHVQNVASLSSMSEEFQIDLEPTKIGACFVKFPQLVGGESDLYAFGISINYEHPFALSTKVSATYNLKDIYDLLIKSGKTSGFFSRKSYRETIESRALTEAFMLHITFDQDVTEEQKWAEENRVKEFLLGYSVSQMTTAATEAGVPGKSGALIASEELSKVCGANAYCQGIAAALRVLDGIFGSSHSRTDVTQTLSVEKTYSSTVTETISIPRTISYTY